MNRTARIVVWVLVIVLSVGSAVYGVSWFMRGRTKHGLLFLPVLPAAFVIIGAAAGRSKGKATGESKAG